MAQAHLEVEGVLASLDATAVDGAVLPVLAVVLLETAAGAEATQIVDSGQLLDLRVSRLVNQAPGPGLDLIGAARVPDPDSAAGRQQREIGEDAAVDRPDLAGAVWAQALLH